MAITIPINETSMPSIIDMETFKRRVTKYAVALLKQMAYAEQVEQKQEMVAHHTSPFIEGLCLRGGETVPADIDESEAIYLEI